MNELYYVGFWVTENSGSKIISFDDECFTSIEEALGYSKLHYPTAFIFDKGYEIVAEWDIITGITYNR